MSAFEVEDLAKRFVRLAAVDGTSFQNAKDEIVGLMEINSSGKVTLSGVPRFKGKDITRLRPLRQLPNLPGNESLVNQTATGIESPERERRWFY